MSMTDGVLTLLPAPEGYVVNFAHPQRQANTETYWVVSVGNFLALLFLGQRLFTKIRLQKQFQIEDTCLVLAWLCSVGTQAVLVRGFASGVIGVHAWEIPLDSFNYYSILILVAPVIYAPCSGFAKLTLLLFYHRLSPQRWFIWTVNVGIFVVVGYTIGIFFSLIFACHPIEKSWNVTMTEGECINLPALYIATAVLGVVTDVVLLVLPVPMVLGLQMPKAQKAGLIAMFTIGSLTLVTSIVRLVILLPTLTDMDQTWGIAFPCTWIAVEANLLIICGSLPTLRKFFRHVAPKIIGESYGGATAPSEPPTGQAGHQRTFGSSGTKKHPYNKFGESEYDMATLNDSATDAEPGLRPDIRGHAHETRVGSGSNRNWDQRPRDDGESEKAIVQTRTTTVLYEDR